MLLFVLIKITELSNFLLKYLKKNYNVTDIIY